MLQRRVRVLQMRTDVVASESLPSAPPSVRAEVCENGRVRVECAPPVDDGGLDILQYEVEVPLAIALHLIGHRFL